MEDPPVRISSEPYEEYGESADIVECRSRVQKFVNKGLMTREKIIQRLTDEIKRGFSDRQELDGVQQSFDALKDPTSNDIPKDHFVEMVSQRFGSQGPALKPGIMILYDMMRKHATYPFWTELPERLCEDAFIRVLALLRSEPYTQIHNSGMSTGSWNGHFGWFMARREKNEQDHKRRLFRGLAEQTDEGTGIPIHIIVPRFEYEEDMPGRVTQRRVLIVEQEDERSVELLDILSQTEPNKDRRTRSAFRDSYINVVPSLLDIQKLPHLSQIGIRRTAFKALITLLIAADSMHRSNFGWATTIDEVSLTNGTNVDMVNIADHSPTHILWKDVDSAASDSFIQTFPLMSRLMDMFITPSIW